MIRSLRERWPEYLMEAAGLGLFMVSAGLFGTLLEYPQSPLHQAIGDPTIRRALMGVVMGATAIFLIYYPWGQQSGAHYNPAVTLTFFRLGKITGTDAVFYILAQFGGGTLGVMLVHALLGTKFSSPPVNYVVTTPGANYGVVFLAEAAISGFLMVTVLATSSSARWRRFTGGFAGLLVATYITLEAPISGMSMNPARTFASAFPGGIWTAWWIYLAAPATGMWLAVDVYRHALRRKIACCAKLNHSPKRRCIFCGYGMTPELSADPAVTPVAA